MIRVNKSPDVSMQVEIPLSTAYGIIMGNPDSVGELQATLSAALASNGTARRARVPHAKRSYKKAAKRMAKAPNGRRNLSKNTVKCPVGGESISSRGARNHVRAHAAREGWELNKANAALDELGASLKKAKA